MTCLIIVDVQNAFLEGGEMQVCNDVNFILPYIKSLQNNPFFSHQIATQHVYPTKKFKNSDRLVKGTYGSLVYQGIDITKLNLIVTKQKFSAFDTDDTLLNYLNLHKIKHLYICGLAYDFCVGETALSAVKYGFDVSVITNASKAYDIISENTMTTKLINNKIKLLDTFSPLCQKVEDQTI